MSGSRESLLDISESTNERMMFGNDVRKRIETDFGPSAETVAAELEQFIETFRNIYKHHPGDRIVRCVVHLARGNEDNLHGAMKLALQDWRDLIMSAEYDRDEKRIHDFNRMFNDNV